MNTMKQNMNPEEILSKYSTKDLLKALRIIIVDAILPYIEIFNLGIQKVLMIIVLVWAFAYSAYVLFEDTPAYFLIIYPVGMICLLLMPVMNTRWNRYLQKREMAFMYLDKIDNPGLTAWKDMAYPHPFSWNMVYIICTAALFIPIDLRTQKCLALGILLELLPQLWERFVVWDKKKYTHPKEILSEFYTALQNSPNGCYPWNKFSYYGILIKDDTNRIPVTFNRGLNRPSGDYLILDKEKDINANERFYASGNKLNLYRLASFFVYVLDASLYSDMQAELENALTYVRHQMSKPVYIYIIATETEELLPIIERYSWMPAVEISIVEDITHIDMEKVSEHYKTELRNSGYGILYDGYTPFSLKETNIDNKPDFFFNCNFYCNWFYTSIPSSDGFYYYQSSNYYLCGFFQNMFRNSERKLAILAGFDYVDMILRFVLYYLAVKKGQGFQEYLVDDDIQFMGDEIVKLLDENDYIYEFIVQKTIPINTTVENALWILKESFHIEFQGEEMTFKGLVYLLRILRNQTRGHGAIQDTVVEQLWYAVYILFVILGDMLHIYHFKIDIQENEIYIGYNSEKKLYPMGQYGMICNDLPCPIYSVSATKKEYINYFKGDVVVPEIIEEDC